MFGNNGFLHKQLENQNSLALESFFEGHAQEVWERNWMNPEMQTALLNTYLQKLLRRF